MNTVYTASIIDQRRTTCLEHANFVSVLRIRDLTTQNMHIMNFGAHALKSGGIASYMFRSKILLVQTC